MKTAIKAFLIIIAIASIACFVVLRLESDEPIAPSIVETSEGPAFEVHVDKPRMSRPLFGIFPTKLERKLFGGGVLRFGHTSSGAKVGSVGTKRIELSADGWKLLLLTDNEGRIDLATRLTFSMELAEKQRTLRCRPAAERATGYLRTNTRAGSGELDGDFLVELAICENAETGNVIEWPPAPLTVRGSFRRLPPGE